MAEIEIKIGGFVIWNAAGGPARGKVLGIIKSGDVPGISVKVTGNPDDPAVKIQVYRPSGDGWLPADVFVGHKFSALKAIEVLKPPTKKETVKAESISFQPQVQLLQLQISNLRNTLIKLDCGN